MTAPSTAGFVPLVKLEAGLAGKAMAAFAIDRAVVRSQKGSRRYVSGEHPNRSRNDREKWLRV